MGKFLWRSKFYIIEFFSFIECEVLRHNRLQDWYSSASLRDQLSHIFADQTTVLKINFAIGFILRNTETSDLQYHHPFANNNLVLELTFLIPNQDDLGRLYDQSVTLIS